MGKYDPTCRKHRQLLASAMIERLQRSGFSEEAVASKGVRERVFYRMVDGLEGVRIKVFTGIVGYGDEAECRSKGRDSIKVCVVSRDFTGQDRGVIKNTRVHRVGLPSAILDRMIERMRKSWRKAILAPKCKKCGSLTFISKKGNRVCANICWERKRNNYHNR